MATRLFVNNIPKYIDADRVREHFSQQGDVTDVRIQKTKDGASRCFGFVGYKTAEQASKALKYFNKSFLDTCRLEVTQAESFKTIDKEAKRPWGKHARADQASNPESVHGGSGGAGTGKRKRTTSAAADSKPADGEANPKLAEFLELMRPRSTAKTYANDELTPVHAPVARAAPPVHASNSDADSDTVRQLDEAGATSDNDDDASNDALNDDISDLEYLKRRMRAFDDAQPSEAAAAPASVPEPTRKKRKSAADTATAADEAPVTAEAGKSDDAPEAPLKAHAAFDEDPLAQIAQTGRLFIRNLPFVTTDDDVLELCAPFGAVTDAAVVKSKVTGKSKGFVHVTFASAGDAAAAYTALDASIFQGRLIHVLPGKRPQTARDDGGDGASHAGTGSDAADEDKAASTGHAASSYKVAKEAQRKADAGNRKAWSTFFMREDTVADAVADLMGVSKASLLAADSDSAAVSLALGEAQVLAATKGELADAGVNVAGLEAAANASGSAADTSAVARSASVLLVKNLPYSCTEDALHDLFGKFGGAKRVVLPSTRALAIVELPSKQAGAISSAGHNVRADMQEARAAFSGLAYKRFQHVPLYLEFAPRDIFDAPAAPPRDAPPGSDAEVLASVVPKARKPANTTATATPEADNDDAADAVSLYVKNVSFSTSQEALRAFFDQGAAAAGGQLRAVRLVLRKRPDGKVVPKGFAFAEFDGRDTARAVMKALQSRVLDGHPLQLELSTKKSVSAPTTKTAAAADQSETKLLVRNLAFEASAKDVRKLMEAFGRVKTCRLPKKFDGAKRGFAFVEFAEKGDARNAMQSAHGTHLYGRRMLLEYAKEEEGLDELRAKTAAQLRE